MARIGEEVEQELSVGDGSVIDGQGDVERMVALTKMMAMVVRTTKKRAKFWRRIDAAEFLTEYARMLQCWARYISRQNPGLHNIISTALLYHLARANRSWECNIRSIIQCLCSASTSGLLVLRLRSCTNQYPSTRFYPVARIISFLIVLVGLSV